MKLDWLTYFQEVARIEHLGRAARVLCVSQSAVSRAIKLLEQEVGCALFESYGKRIRLTTQGRRLFEKVSTITKEIDHLPSFLRGEVKLRGHYKLAATNLLLDVLLAPAIPRILADFPEFKCDLRSLRSSEVVSGILRQEFDLGLCFSPQAHPDLDAMTIYEGHLVLVTNLKHPVQKSKRLADLSAYGAVLPPAIQGIDICERHPMFDHYAIIPRPVCTFDHYGVAAEIVSKSSCWSFFPDFLVTRFQKKVAALPTPKKWVAPFRISLIYHRKRPNDGLSKFIQEALRINVLRSFPH